MTFPLPWHFLSTYVQQIPVPLSSVCLLTRYKMKHCIYREKPPVLIIIRRQTLLHYTTSHPRYQIESESATNIYHRIYNQEEDNLRGFLEQTLHVTSSIEIQFLMSSWFREKLWKGIMGNVTRQLQPSYSNAFQNRLLEKVAVVECENPQNTFSIVSIKKNNLLQNCKKKKSEGRLK